MTRPSEPSAPLPGADNLVTVMGGVGKPDPADRLARSVPRADERLAQEPTLLGGSLPPFAR
jgi:hypothetical protein